MLRSVHRRPELSTADQNCPHILCLVSRHPYVSCLATAQLTISDEDSSHSGNRNKAQSDRPQQAVWQIKFSRICHLRALIISFAVTSDSSPL